MGDEFLALEKYVNLNYLVRVYLPFVNHKPAGVLAPQGRALGVALFTSNKQILAGSLLQMSRRILES